MRVVASTSASPTNTARPCSSWPVTTRLNPTTQSPHVASRAGEASHPFAYLSRPGLAGLIAPPAARGSWLRQDIQAQRGEPGLGYGTPGGQMLCGPAPVHRAVFLQHLARDGGLVDLGGSIGDAEGHRCEQ